MRLSRLLEAMPFHHDQPGPPAPCRCGHVSVAHEHYRRGSDCALCGCARYRRNAAGRGVLAPPTPLYVETGSAAATVDAHERPGAA